MNKKLYISQIKDPAVQQNFKAIGSLFGQVPFLKGEWVFLTVNIITTGVNLKIPHNLGFQPLDVILLSAIGGSVTFNYNLFDSVNLNLNATVTTSPMAIRMFIGRYSEDSVNV